MFFFHFQFVEIFRLCKLEEAIYIIECILRKQIDNPGVNENDQAPSPQAPSNANNHQENNNDNYGNDSDAKSDDKHDVILDWANKEEKIVAVHSLDEVSGTEVIEKSVPLTIVIDKNQDQTRPDYNIASDKIDSDLNEHIQAVHERYVKSDNDICDVDDEIIEKIVPMTIDENKIQVQKRSHDLIQMPEIDNQPLKRIKLCNLLVNYSDSSESDTSQIDEEPEETYNNKTELVEEDVAANNLKYDHEFDKKNETLTTRSSACRICGSTFPTVQEIMKHISGNLHDF